MSKKLVVIGLDCVTPQLFFGEWLEEMPTIKRLVSGGLHGKMVSTIPAITVPAWMAMMTSQDPGQLGVYGFRNRASHQYEDLYITNSKFIKAKTLWNHLSRSRMRSLLLGVPLTYPPKPLNGVMVSSFLTPGKEVDYTYPPEYKHKLDEVAEGDYVIDVKDFRTSDKEWLLGQIYDMTRRRFKAFRHMLQSEEWDFAMMVEMGPDRMHHGFWRYCDPQHRLYEKGNPYESTLRDYYLYMDKEIGQTLEVLPEDVSVIVISDHGAKGMRGGICINEWLIQEGLLAVKKYPETPQRLRTNNIDWEKTQVWGEGGYYARIFMNVEGREPDGTIPAAQYEAFRKELKDKIEAIPDENGNPIGTQAFYPEEIYRACTNIAPDLIVYLGDLSWRSAGSIGHGPGTVHIFENDTGPDDANHAQEGVYIWHNRGKAPQGPSDKISIYDVAPSILDYFGVAVPEEMIGKVI